MYMISIHALREEGDLSEFGRLKELQQISIHALREEGDDLRHKGRARGSNFYPRPPRGGRRLQQEQGRASSTFLSTPSARRATRRRSASTIALKLFLSTPSARRATCSAGQSARRMPISIHALREEGDCRL